MNAAVLSCLIKALEQALVELKSGKCEIDDEQAEQLLNTIAHKPMSREDVLIRTGMSSSAFAMAVRENRMPEGRKRRGWKELVWYKDEIEEAIVKMNHFK